VATTSRRIDGPGQQVGPQRRQLDVARRAVEEPETELVLQLPDQHAQARWRDEECFGGPAEALMLGDQVEPSQLP
jgi:hypothetical protein